MAGRAGKKEAGKSKTKPALKKGVGRAKREKKVEEQTHIALEKYRILFESFPLGISITDDRGNLIEANKESERLLGMSRDEHDQLKYDGPEWKIVRPDGTPMPPEEYASVRALRENRRIENVEMGIVKNGDEITWINVTAEPIPLENFGVAITYGDISSRKRLENDLEKQRREFKHIIDSAPIIIFYKDLAGRMIRVNKTFSEALNLSEGEILGKTVFDVYSAPVAQAMTDDDQEVLRTGRPKLNIEEPYESASGIRWVRTDKVPIIDDSGRTVGLVGFAQDITERKRAEEALLESEKHVKMKLDAILSPQGDIGKLELGDILDIQAIQSIMDDFHKLTNISAWILDVKGNILVSTGWRDICTQFHRANIELCENCIESDTQLSQGVAPGTFKMYKCKNNMWDLVTPITVGGKHIGNLFLGQFLFDDETVDYELFRSQARRHGFNEAEYLAALERVPRFSRETIDTSMSFYSKFAHMISTLSHSNIALARSLTEKNGLLSALQASEEQYRLLAEHTTDFVWLMDMNLTPTYQSPSAERLTGFTHEELAALPFEKRLTPESLQLAAEMFLKEMPLVAADPEYNPILTLELEIYRKDGSTLWSENKFSIIRDENGQPVSILGEARDITNRKLAEAALHVSGEKYRSLVETSGAGIASFDLKGNFIFTNATVCLWAGLTVADIIGQPLNNLIHPDDTPALVKMLSNMTDGETAGSDFEFRIIHKDGNITWLYTNPTPIILDGKSVGFNAILQDITRRKQAEEALRQSEAKYSTVLEQIEEAYYEVDLDGNLTFFNEATCHQLGYSVEELKGMNYRVYTSKEDMRHIYEIFNQVYLTGKPNTGFSVSRIRKDGSRLFTENSALPMRDEAGKIIGFRGVARDVTERKRAEEAIRESEEQYRLLAEHTTDTVWLLDMNLKTTYTSPSSEKLLGFTQQELIEMPLEKYLVPDSLNLAAEALFAELPRIEADPSYNPIVTLELEYYRKDGTTLWAENKFNLIRDANGKPVSILGETRDITERREAKKKLEQTLAALEKTLRDTVIAISKMVEMKDPFTAGHQIRVAQLASAIASKMNMPDEQIAILNTAATIHDIGKIYVPSDILSKPGKLNPLEYEIIQTHVRGSYEILMGIDFAGPIAEIVFQHHERMDGSGYPRALKGADILPEAKILIVADVVEAMSSHRPYRASMGIDKALEEISINRGKLYDEAAVDACLDLFNNDRFWFSPVESS
ncbi:MAG: PAS domain S-box protein [Dehalococcoidia bacterium]|jgi:PAS domain-containing protein